MLHAKGDLVLMLDADGATKVDEISKFVNLIGKVREEFMRDDDNIIIIGSRNHLVEQVSSQRDFFRKIPSLVNNIFVRYIVGIKDIKDTQCGFKLFTRTAVQNLFPKMHLNRWAFDVELLYLAQRYLPHKLYFYINYFYFRQKALVIEEPVNWQEISGGNLEIFSASVSFFRDYFALLTFYTLGIW